MPLIAIPFIALALTGLLLAFSESGFGLAAAMALTAVLLTLVF